MTTIHVEVTPDDIYRGDPRNSLKCPIARAIRRTPWFNTKGGVNVRGEFLQYREGNLNRSRKLPPEAIAFIKSYDNSEPVAAFSFDLEVAR